MDKAISIIIAEDYLFVRKGIHALFDLTRDFLVVGEAGNGLEAVALVEEKNPDVLILDINMPRMDGIQVIEHLHKSGSRTKILIHTGEDDPVFLRSLYELGVAGVLPKGCNPETLIDAVRMAAGAGTHEYKPGWSRAGKIISSA